MTSEHASRARRLALLSIGVLAACQTAPPSPSATGLGALPRPLLELYDLGDPQGILEIDANRDGTIVAIGADIAIDALPTTVVQGVMAAAPGGRITGAARQRTPDLDRDTYAVEIDRGGAAWEFVVDSAGKIVATEHAIDPADAPAEVLAAADRAVPAGQRTSVEVITRGAARAYHVKKRDRDARYKIEIELDGTVVRAVREARAEIEIPLVSR